MSLTSGEASPFDEEKRQGGKRVCARVHRAAPNNVRELMILNAHPIGRVDGHVIWNRKEKGRFPEVASPRHPPPLHTHTLRSRAPVQAHSLTPTPHMLSLFLSLAAFRSRSRPRCVSLFLSLILRAMQRITHQDAPTF